MRIAAFIFGLLGGLAALGLSSFGQLIVGLAAMGGASADTQTTAQLIIWGPPVAAFAGAALALASPFIGAVLMAGAVAAWLYLFSFTGHAFNVFNASPVLLTGLGAFFAVVAMIPAPRSRRRRYDRYDDDDDDDGRGEFVALPTEYDQNGNPLPTRYIREAPVARRRPPRVLGYALSILFVAAVAGFIVLILPRGATPPPPSIAAVSPAAVPMDTGPNDTPHDTTATDDPPTRLSDLSLPANALAADLPVVDPHAYYAMLPRIAQFDSMKRETWIYSMAGTSGLMKTGVLHGKDAVFGTICKPHDCHDNVFAYVVTVDGSSWIGAVYMASISTDRVSMLLGSDATDGDSQRVIKMVTDVLNGE